LPEPGSPANSSDLLPFVYTELRRLAAFKMASEPPGHTLQPTALVHEAWLRLSGEKGPCFNDRSHFFAVAAEAMRRILIDRARRRQRLRHGGGQERVEIEDMQIASAESDERLLQVHELVDRLAAEHPDQAAVVKLRFFVGLTDVEIAQALDVSERTVERHWAYAKVWLLRAARAS
jgi:RNA polymerase sigma factor (TIGR02999 family)